MRSVTSLWNLSIKSCMHHVQSHACWDVSSCGDCMMSMLDLGTPSSLQDTPLHFMWDGKRELKELLIVLLCYILNHLAYNIISENPFSSVPLCSLAWMTLVRIFPLVEGQYLPSCHVMRFPFFGMVMMVASTLMLHFPLPISCALDAAAVFGNSLPHTLPSSFQWVCCCICHVPYQFSICSSILWINGFLTSCIFYGYCLVSVIPPW